MRFIRAHGSRLLAVVIVASMLLPTMATASEAGELKELRQMLAAQQAQIEVLQQTLKNQQVILDAQQELLQVDTIQAGPTEADDVAATVALEGPAEPDRDASESPERPDASGESQTVEAQVVALTDSEEDAGAPDAADEESPEHPKAAEREPSIFPGSWGLVGSNARLRLGGYVKMNIVDNLDPLLSEDRFIVGTIPTSGTAEQGPEKDITLTVAQSRVNLELREEREGADLRAFVEGDFFGAGDTFRLRHAFGQYGQMLAGKTWSTLMDLETKPEELDFEGINGRVNVRHAQLRFFPTIGDSVEFTLALEDPSPDVSGGSGISEWPDLVVGVGASSFGFLGRMNRERGWNARVAFIARQIKARSVEGGFTDTATGWGVTASGHSQLPYWSGDDKFLWQVTYGEGIGRYINDLGTIGGQDAIFSPRGDLKTWPVLAGYVSYQHWWRSKLRSSLTLSIVDVDTYDFQSTPTYLDAYGSPYERTLRASVNLIYSPIRRVHLGAEYLWGRRENADDTEGTARQLQLSAKYYY